MDKSNLQQAIQALDSVGVLGGGADNEKPERILNAIKALRPFISECPLCEIHKESEQVLDETLSKLKEDSKVDPAELDIPIISDTIELDIEGLTKEIGQALNKEMTHIEWLAVYAKVKSLISKYAKQSQGVDVEALKDDEGVKI